MAGPVHKPAGQGKTVSGELRPAIRTPLPRSSRLHLRLPGGWERANFFSVFVAPTPILARFKRLYDRMFGFLKMRRGMFSGGTVATSYLTTSPANAELYGGLSCFGAIVAGVGIRLGNFTLG